VSGARDRGDVVVRVRKIAEDRAAASLAAAAGTAAHAQRIADEAAARSRVHPLGTGATELPADALLLSVGTGAALREAARHAADAAAAAQAALQEAQAVAAEARSRREAAERFQERRRETAAVEAARRSQRQLDENALSTRGAP
jgi:hypothetical protein